MQLLSILHHTKSKENINVILNIKKVASMFEKSLCKDKCCIIILAQCYCFLTLHWMFEDVYMGILASHCIRQEKSEKWLIQLFGSLLICTIIIKAKNINNIEALILSNISCREYYSKMICLFLKKSRKKIQNHWIIKLRFYHSQELLIQFIYNIIHLQHLSYLLVKRKKSLRVCACQ